MTATAHSTTAAGIGRVARVIGPVVDVEFAADQIPEIGNALLVETEVMGEKRTMTMETALHVGDNLIRAIALKPTDGMRRGAEVRDTGAPISVPVGEITKGHVWNVTGDVLNVDPASIHVTERWPIHRPAPEFDALEPRTEMLETGIKVLDLLTPAPPNRLRASSYSLRFSGFERIVLASEASLKRASAALSPGLASGWLSRAIFRKAFLISSALAFLSTPRTL